MKHCPKCRFTLACRLNDGHCLYKCWVINVGGNRLRVIAFIQFVKDRLYVKHILTHAEYAIAGSASNVAISPLAHS